MAEKTHPELVALLAGMEDLDRVKAAEQVADTMSTPGWTLITRLVDDRRAQLLDALVAHGGVRSEAEYAAKLAEVRGCSLALDLCQTVLRGAKAAAARLSEAERAS